MEFAIIDEYIFHLVASPYKYLTILATKDLQDNDILKFRVDVTNFTQDQKQKLYSLLKFFYLSQEEYLLPITDSEEYENEEGKTIFECSCFVPILTTVSSYYSRNKCLETEIRANILDVVAIYKLMTKNKLPVDVSFDTISILQTRSIYPFPKLIITPFAAFKAFFNSIDGIQTPLHKPYADLFKFFNTKLDEMTEKGLFSFIGKTLGKQKNPFDEVVKVLQNDNDANEILDQNDYLNRARMSLELPKFRMDELTLVKTLGEGAFGAVCWVLRKGTENYAMKQCTEENIPDLFKEAFIMHDMDHRNILRMNGFMYSQQNIIPEWEDGNVRGFLLMEMCQHKDLENYIDSFKTSWIPAPTVKLIFGQLADAVIYLHSRRYVHRDLKTANVLMEQIEPFPWIKLCDFGLATSNDSIITGFAGTPLTMDTRTLKGETYTDRADLFSVACILYALIYKVYPGDSCRNKAQLIDLLERKQVDYSLKEGMGKEYQPLIDLCKFLIEQTDKRLKVGERRDNEVFWTEFKKHPVVKECMDIAQKKMKLYEEN